MSRTTARAAVAGALTVLLLPLAAAGALALAASSPAPAPAGVVGRAFPDVDIEGLTQTGAESFDDFAGRAVLIEFFAYW